MFTLLNGPPRWSVVQPAPSSGRNLIVEIAIKAVPAPSCNNTDRYLVQSLFPRASMSFLPSFVQLLIFKKIQYQPVQNIYYVFSPLISLLVFHTYTAVLSRSTVRPIQKSVCRVDI